jgi:hypothetical protein
MTIAVRRVAGALAAAVSVALVLTPAAAQATPTPQAGAAAEWLADQVPADTHLFVSVYGAGESDRFVDYGLNLDLQNALDQLGDSVTADEVYGAVIADTAAYTDAFGTRYSGAVGKLATYVALHGDDPTSIDSRNLIDELADLLVTEGAEKGRLKDDPDGDSQSANTVGQSWGVRAFAAAGSDDVDAAAGFLSDQQCADGGFRLVQKGEDCESSVDATTLAVMALDELGGYDTEVADAQRYLLDEQAADGSLSDSGVSNSNSTGLATTVFSSLGDTAAATAGVDWIVPLQVVTSTSGLENEAGAIAFDSDAFDAGVSDGIDDIERDQWVRTTAQAATALNVTDAADSDAEPGISSTVQTWQLVAAAAAVAVVVVLVLEGRRRNLFARSRIRR